MLYDDGADHPGMQAAEIIANSGARLEYVTPERQISPDIGGTNLTPYMRSLLPQDIRFTLCRRAIHAEKDGDRIRVVLGSDYGDFESERVVDQLIVEHGTIPLDDVYYQLKSMSSNHGEVDQEALIRGEKQAIMRKPDSRFQLFRIGDAVSSPML